MKAAWLENQHDVQAALIQVFTVCPRSSDPFYIVTDYVNWVTTSWTDGIVVVKIFVASISSIFLMTLKRCCIQE